MTKYFLACYDVHICGVIWSACMGIQVAARRPRCCRGTASFANFHYVVNNCRTLSTRLFTMFSSILLHFFSVQQGKFLTVPKNTSSHPNIGQVSAQLKEWFALSFWNRICHTIYNVSGIHMQLVFLRHEADGSVLWWPPITMSYTVLMLGRLRLKCDGTRVETRFRLSAKRTSPFKSARASVQSTTGSRGVRISGNNGSNAGYTMFRGCVKGTGYPLHSPVSR